MRDRMGRTDDRAESVFITVRDLKDIHRRLIDAGPECEAGLRDAVRDDGTLDFIVSGANRIDDHLERASFLMHRIAVWHPFYEGNKRTALSAADGTLRVYSKMCIAESPERVNDFVRKVASGSADECEIALWLKNATKAIR